LATEDKTPLREGVPSNSGRPTKTADRSKVARNRIIAGVVAAVVVLVAIFLLTRGGGPLHSIIDNSTPPGKVDFQLKGSTFVPTQLKGDKKAQQDAAKVTANDVRRQLDVLFDTAYVDPDTWGDTGKIKDLFTGGAKDQLDGDVKTLTLGENAGDTYKSVDPRTSNVKVRVLTDARGNAIRASGALTFTALATHDDGTYSEITVTGTVIFVQDGGTWKIEAYNLSRSEKPAKAPAPSGSTSPTAEAT
jgi:hypothetical protein